MARDRLRDQAVGAVLRRLREGQGASGRAMTQREVAQAIGLIGPVPEGIVTWLVAAAALVAACVAIGNRRSSG